MKKRIALLLCAALLAGLLGCEKPAQKTIPHWRESSPAMASIIAYVDAITDEKSADYLPPERRIAVFDLDGTLFGERFPTYFDQDLLMYRLLHDPNCPAAPEDQAFAEALEYALLHGEPEPDSPRSTGQMAAESFKGFTVEEYRACVRRFMAQPAAGFEGMNYGQGFFQPMVSLVQYLTERGVRCFIVSGAERSLLRELTAGTLDEWIPAWQILGSTFSLEATGQGDTEGRSYTYTAEDRVLLEGNMSFKNLKMNKIVSIVDEIGVKPVLAFGNSSGDFAMGQYALENGGRAYMLLCDDVERDYGDLEEAAEFAAQCRELGFETVSMHDEFETIYGEDVVKTAFLALDPAA